MRKVFISLVVAVLGCTAVATATAGAAPYCGLIWGSLAEHDGRHTSATISNLRAGEHPCFDRLVIDLGPKEAGLPGPDASGYSVEYVSRIADDRTGAPVTLTGDADLQIVVHARAVDDVSAPTYRPADPAHALDVSGFQTFRQVAFLGTAEAQSTIGLGVRARLPFRVFMLAGPGDGARLVIDVAHRW